MIRINELKAELDEPQEFLRARAAKLMKIQESDICQLRIVKRSVDSRKKDNVCFVYSLDIKTELDEKRIIERDRSGKLSQAEEYHYELPEVKRKSVFRPVIAGFGPAGIFCALTLARCGQKPIVLERGQDVDTRTAQVNRFFGARVLDEESNVQFGEGGAGTFSDGKLTTGIKSPFIKQVFNEFAAHGAPEEIIYSAKPHIGTDRLCEVIKNIRNEIISLGGDVLFGAKLTGIIAVNGRIQGVSYEKNGVRTDIETDSLVLACGHSARDTVSMLFDRGVNMMQKPFSVGARIEHPREMIDRAQYGKFAGHPALGAADYKMACHPPHGRGAYTFCMCPGGTVVAATSIKGCVVTNGMSIHARNGENSNSAILVGIEPENFPDSHPLSGFALQTEIERKGFKAGGGDYSAPAQLVGDFLSGMKSTAIGCVKPTYPLGVRPSDIRDVLPKRITDEMKFALVQMDKKLNGFTMKEAVLTAPETRSSSPVRILRDEYYQTNIRGLYPCGEGAGYAGGIVSAAVDGMKCAHALLSDEL